MAGDGCIVFSSCSALRLKLPPHARLGQRTVFYPLERLTLDLRLFIAVLGLALLESLNPMLFAGELYILRGAHPERRAFAFIAGVFVVMVVGGLLLAGGLTDGWLPTSPGYRTRSGFMLRLRWVSDWWSLVCSTAHLRIGGRFASL